MINRNIEKKILELSGKMPVISITGPRQSGKTTLAKKLFPKYKYVNFEDIEKRIFAKNDPKGFLKTYENQVIFDEIQNVPELFSYIQVAVDNNAKIKYVITGSQNFLLLEKISQSLAGRVAVFNLLPLSINELQKSKYASNDSGLYIIKGGYPRIYDKNLQPADWLESYITTYVERDVRKIINVSDLSVFQKFLKLCAGRTGQLINFSSVANELATSFHTVQSWLSVLEASFIVFRLQPYSKNFNKRLVKSPKLYFYDTGLACSLLGIQTLEQLQSHYLKGELFESLIISEFYKHQFNIGRRPSIYFWRNNLGQEIDCILEDDLIEKAVEIKSGMTIHQDFFKNLNYWNKLSGNKPEYSFIVYGGEESQKRSLANVVSWNNLQPVFQ